MARDDVEPQELATLLDAIVGEQEPGDDDLAEYQHLTARGALLQAAADEVAARRRTVVARMYGGGKRAGGMSSRELAGVLGDVTYGRVDEMVSATQKRRRA